MLPIVVALSKWSSPDVRFDAKWVALYAMAGAAWLQLGLFLLSLSGIGAREDVLERQNPAAAWPVYGTLTGTAFCYAGANVGSGPGVGVVLFCAVLSTTFLFGSWFCLERIFRMADRVAVERDEGAGIRIGGWISSQGLILGAAVTGDWKSPEGTFPDFIRSAYPALLLLLAAIFIEWAFKLFQKQRNPTRGVSTGIALTYLLLAAIYAHWRGLP